MRSLAVVVAFVGALGSRAYADEEADKLFEEAQQLKQAGKHDEACAKYEEALVHNRNAVGTLLNVGKCSEDSGKIATAVRLYSQARDLAREHNLDEHRAAAEQRIAEIGARVPTLEVAFSERLDGMKLVIDDEIFPTDDKSIREIKLDPGTRHVVVTAPGRVPYSKDVVLAEGKQHAVAIPALAHPVTVKRARRSVGQILTFSGGALALTGVILGYIANRDYEAQVGPIGSDFNCMQAPGKDPLCNAEGYRRTSDAYTLGNVGTVVGIAGLVALGAGAVLWFTAPSETVPQEQRQVRLVPAVTPDSAGITAIGRF